MQAVVLTHRARVSMKSTGSSYEPWTPAQSPTQFIGGNCIFTGAQGPCTSEARHIKGPSQNKNHVPLECKKGAGFEQGGGGLFATISLAPSEECNPNASDIVTAYGAGRHGPAGLSAMCNVEPLAFPRCVATGRSLPA